MTISNGSATLAADVAQGVGRATGQAPVVTPESMARFAGLLADRSRAAMCLALIDGRAWTAGELAQLAGVGRPTASQHLDRLVAAGLLIEEHQGRHRYLRLAGPEMARLIEDLVGVAGQPQLPNSLRSVRAAGELSRARTCYDHIAGTLGVVLFDAMVDSGLVRVTDGLLLTQEGRIWFTEFAGEHSLASPTSRPLLRACLDWTERRSHLGGALGAVLLSRMLATGWVVSAERHRGLLVTAAGADGLSAMLGVEFAATLPVGA